MPSSSPRRKLRPLQLMAVIFLTVSGGPYGLEPLFNYAGNNGALLLLIVTPLLFDIPTIFTVLELNSMMPVTGGYYQWVKKALGMRWAFFEGWWTWLYTFVDLAIYPVLFVSYAAYFFPMTQEYKIPVCLFIIWASAGLNILGIVPVGRVSLVLGAVVITPFLVLFGYALWKNGSVAISAPGFQGHSFSSIGMGLYTIMWNFIGWDNTTTYAEEVDRPVRSYLISLAGAFILIFLLYFITIVVTQQSGIHPAILEEKGFSFLGNLIGGHWLGSLIAIGGMASALGLYSAVLLSVSRVPEVMAEDRLLPAKLHTLHTRFKTPYVSILVCSVIVSFLVRGSFEQLLIVDIALYGAGLCLEFISLIVLRKKEPAMNRPFKIRLNIPGLCLMVVLPFSVYFIALFAAFTKSGKTLATVLFAIGALLSAELIWQLITLKNKRIR